MSPTDTESEAVLAAAMAAFADVPGVDVIDEPDALRSVAPGRPWPFLNTIARIRLAGDFEAERLVELERPYLEAELPVMWSMTDLTSPVDLDDRLARRGLAQGDWDATMMIDLQHSPVSTQTTLEAAATAGITLEIVDKRTALDEWIEVMADSYGWSDVGRAQAMREVYDPELPHGRSGRRTHVLARLEDHAVGSSSLFETAGQGWITNIGAIPAARGRGVGAAVTSAVLELAQERGFERAWLGASEMGAPVYRRLGFSTEGVAKHRLGPAPQPSDDIRA
jgi:GNAT superfamily N-acetyltransferase